MKCYQRVIWRVYGLLPESWPHDVRMFITGMILGSVVSIPAVIVLTLVGVS